MESNKAVLDHLDNYQLSKESFLKIIKDLTYYHYEKCYSYKSILKKYINLNLIIFQLKIYMMFHLYQ